MKNLFKSLLKTIKKINLFMQSIVNTVLLTFVYFLGVGLGRLFYKISKKSKNQENKDTYWADYKDSKDHYRLF